MWLSKKKKRKKHIKDTWTGCNLREKGTTETEKCHRQHVLTHAGWTQTQIFRTIRDELQRRDIKKKMRRRETDFSPMEVKSTLRLTKPTAEQITGEIKIPK